MTLSVVTLHFGELPYFEDSCAINAAYCARHGLPWSVVGPGKRADRHAVWGKVDLLAIALASSEFALYLDADAVFVDHTRSPADLIERLGRKQLLLVRDRTGQANTGIILARRSETSLRMLQEWFSVPKHDTTHAFTWPLEQGAFGRHIVGRYSSELELVSSAELDPFIRHHAGISLAAKTRAISRERAILECP